MTHDKIPSDEIVIEETFRPSGKPEHVITVKIDQSSGSVSIRQWNYALTLGGDPRDKAWYLDPEIGITLNLETKKKMLEAVLKNHCRQCLDYDPEGQFWCCYDSRGD